MKYDTINDAAHAWVREFNAIPVNIIENLLIVDPDNVLEVTPPSTGDRVLVFGFDYNYNGGEIEAVTDGEDGWVYGIKMDNGEECWLQEADFEVERDESLPIWGTMWAFDSQLDNYWLEEPGNMQLMANCGFRIYEQEDYEYIFGIDGAGYDFYESHWEPLYKARGLKWHKEAKDEQLV